MELTDTTTVAELSGSCDTDCDSYCSSGHEDFIDFVDLLPEVKAYIRELEEEAKHYKLLLEAM